MTDLSSTIIAKSDQLNADDLIGGGIIITITNVAGVTGDQPIAISYEGDNNKPWKPCKTMRRVLVSLWGSDGKLYVGRKLALYRDPAVKFGGIEVGGIRISHASHIDKPMLLALTASKGSKKQVTIKPLVDAAEIDVPALKTAGASAAEIGTESLKNWWQSIGAANQKAVGGSAYLDELKITASNADKKE